MLSALGQRLLRSAPWLAAIGLYGCALFAPPARVPMELLRPDGGACHGLAPVLLVMLPGAYSRPAEFVDEGFVAAVRRRGLAADIVVVDAHLGYFKDRSIATRLREDVIRPARERGYRQIWLVGISLGGFAALGYGAQHAGDVDGVVAFAPYLGRPELLKEIADAGGPAAWRAAIAAPPAGELDRELWAWLATPAPALSASPPVYLGWGRDDRFAATNRLLSTVLPAGHAAEVPGDHDWPAWRALWSGWLDRQLLPVACEAAP